MDKLNKVDLINGIHEILEYNKLPLEDSKKELIDEKMLAVLSDDFLKELEDKYIERYSCNPNNKEDMEKTIEYIEFFLTRSYYAMYNDNEVLYSKMINDKSIDLGNNKKDNKLYLLDKNFTNMFEDSEEYFNFIDKLDPAIKRFYNSLPKETEDRKKYFKMMENILKNDKRFLYRKQKDQKIIFINLLNKDNLDIYGTDISKLTYKQKDFVDSIDSNLKKANKYKLKELIENYPKFEYSEGFTDDFIEYFDVDDIALINPSQIKLYSRAIDENLVDRMKDIFERKESFKCPIDFIDKDVFNIIENELIVILSKKAKDKISKLEKNEDFKKQVKQIVKKDLKEAREKAKEKSSKTK